MKISVSDYEDYLYDYYKEHGIDTSLFMKLVEEVGEVAEVLNKRDGRKASDSEDLKSQLANELVDVIHYALDVYKRQIMKRKCWLKSQNSMELNGNRKAHMKNIWMFTISRKKNAKRKCRNWSRKKKI